jgi:hypothetical protein
MRTYNLRIYTLTSREALDIYKDVIYPRHLVSFEKYGIRPHGFWTVPDDDKPRLFVLVSLDDGVDPGESDAQFMQSPELLEDFNGFDPAKLVEVEQLVLIPTASSPLQ